MVINGRQKLFVTNDASTILNEIEVFHPAAKLLIMNSKRQEAEVCDRRPLSARRINTIFYILVWRFYKLCHYSRWRAFRTCRITFKNGITPK